MERQYLFTERAHLMCPGMCFGVAGLIPVPYDAGQIRRAIDLLAAAHPFLQAVMEAESATDRWAYRVTDRCRVEWTEAEITSPTLDAPEVLALYDRLVRRDWDLTSEGMLKLVTWRAADRLGVLMVFHHLLADGRGGLNLLRTFADCCVSGTIPPAAEERLITPSDLPKTAALKGISRILVDRANRQWAKEHVRVTYPEYHAFADEYARRDAVTRRVVSCSQAELAAQQALCRAHDVSMNAYWMAQMAQTDGAEKIIIACDLRSRLPWDPGDALGNYATAFSVATKMRRGDDLMAAAQAIHARVRKILDDPRALYLVLACYARMTPGLLDAAAISAIRGGISKAASFVGGAMFGFAKAAGYSITNLGAIQCPALADALFIPPMSPAVRKIEGIVTVNGAAKICTCERQQI